MKAFLLKHKRLFIDLIVMISVFLFVFIAFFIFKPLYSKSVIGFGSVDGIIPRIFIFLCITAIALTGIILKIKGKLTFEILLFLIFLLGVVMQLNYMLITPFNYRQHDVFSHNNAGHQGYAWTIYTTGHLPTQVDAQGHLDYQFYHPPFNAFMQAMFMHICKPFMNLYNAITGSTYYDTTSMDSLFQTSEILSTFYMNVSIYFGIKIVYRLKVDHKFKVFGALFIALFPALIILAGQENNDPLCIMNCFIVMYFTFRWWENRSMFNAIMIGLFTGLAMFAKLSGALIAVPAIVAYIYSIIEGIVKKEKFAHYFLQGAIIALLVLPLGLWFHIYAKIKFDQPFGFVFANLNNELYVGDHSFFARFINIFDFKDMTYSLWGNTFENYNLPNFLIKSALFGEYSFMCSESLGVLALAFNYLFTYSSIVLMVLYFIFSKKENLEVKIIAGVLVLSQLIAQLYFNIKMPYGCTMDFRYIVPIIIGFMVLDVLAIDFFIKKNDWKKYYAIVTFAIGGLLLISTTSFYLFAI